MSNIHAHARTREAAADWLAKEKPLSDSVLNGHQRQRIFDAFAAGAIWAITPSSEADVNQIVAGVIRDAQATGTDEAADYAALAIFAYLGAIHREEQDLWHERFAAAGDLIAEAAGLFRSYEAQHRDKAARWRHQMHGPDSLRKTQADIDDTLAKAERNRQIAEKLERWVMGRNPAEVLRGIAESMVDGDLIKGVDHASFDAAAEELARPVPWRTEGVADLAAFRITTGDPRFDPGEPVTVNGFLYVPASKENEHG